MADTDSESSEDEIYNKPEKQPLKLTVHKKYINHAAAVSTEMVAIQETERQPLPPPPPPTADESLAEWAVENMCYNPGEAQREQSITADDSDTGVESDACSSSLHLYSL